MKPKISLIIAVYEHADFLEKIFISLKNQTFKDFEIIVADDGSGPSIKKVITHYNDSFSYPIKHIWQEDKGFRKTIIINKAVIYAGAEYFVFIDGDCILHHRFLEYHNKRKKPNQVLTGRRVMFSKQLSERITLKDVEARRFEKISFWFISHRKGQLRHGIFLPGIFHLRNINRNKSQILGSNFSVSKEDYYKVNGYDERILGRGLEDNNLCNRVILANIKVKTIAHEALQYHLFHTSDPIPHDDETIRRFRDNPESFWTPYGIIKSKDEGVPV
jgi:glycosyltransferase involved in cell wall biosynthesis